MHPLFPHLLAELLPALAQDGFSMGVDWHLRQRLLLEKLPEDATPEYLRDALCAITATDPAGQKRFTQLFEIAWKEVEKRQKEYDFSAPKIIETTLPEAENDERKGLVKPPPHRPWLAWLVAAILLVLAATWAILPPSYSSRFRSDAVNVGATQRTLIRPDSVVQGIALPYERAAFTDSTRLESERVADTLSTPFATYFLRDSAQIEVQPKDSLGTDTLDIFFLKPGTTVFSKKNIFHWTLPVRFEQRGKASGSTEVQEEQQEVSGKATQVTSSKLAQALRDSLLLKLKIQDEATPLQRWLVAYQLPIKIGGLALLAALLAAWVYWRERRRKPPLVAERERRDQPPYVWNIEVENPEDAVGFGDTFFSLANRLRRREGEDAWRLDVPGTISATIKKGGLPEFLYKQLSRPPEYLLLLDRKDINDHRAALFDHIAKAFQKQEVLLDCYFFAGDPRLCWNEKHPEGINIRELHYLHPNARLLLLSTGHRLLGNDGQLLGAAQVFEAWRYRSLLSPTPLSEWGQPERRLSERFTVLPAELESLLYLTDLDEELTPGLVPLRPAPGMPIPPTEPIPLGEALMPTLKAHFNEAEMRWLAACAIWPTVHYDLTLWLGRWLKGAVPAASAAGNTPNLSTFKKLTNFIWTIVKRRAATNGIKLPESFKLSGSSIPTNSAIQSSELQSLFRLEWFLEGEIPRHDRQTLLEWLETTDHPLLRRLQAAIHGLLAQNPPPKNSAAWPGFEMNLALLEWRSTAGPARRAELEAKLEEMLRIGIKPDFTVVKYLDRPRNPLDNLVPDSFRRYLHPAGKPGLGWRKWVKEAALAAGCWLVALGAALWWQPALPDACKGESVVWRGQKLCLVNPADHALYRERLACDALAHAPMISWDQPDDKTETDIPFVDSLTARTRAELPPGDSSRAQFERYVGYSLVDKSGQYLRRADSVMAVFNGRKNDAVEFDEAFACYYLNQAFLVDSTNETTRRNHVACLNGSFRPYAQTERYANALTRNAVTAVRTVFAQKGYVFEEYYPNIIALRRSKNRQPDAWQDQLLVLWRTPDSIWQSRTYLCTTMPGQYFAQNPGNPKGAPMIAPGQYLNLFEPGVVRNRSALVQRGMLTLYRDANKSGAIDAGDPIDRGDSFGMNIHNTKMDQEPATIGQWSEGNIVMPRKNERAELQRIYTTAYQNQGRRFALTLLTQEDMPGLFARVLPEDFSTIDSTQPERIDLAGTAAGEVVEKGLETATARPRRSGLEMVAVEGGAYTMGSPESEKGRSDDECQHPVTVKSFEIGKYEVTQADWREVMGEYPLELNNKGCDECPVERVSWDDVQEFLIKLNEKYPGKNYRLPSEEEWEYAARGGIRSNGYLYAGSNNIADVAWYEDNYETGNTFGEQKSTHPVGELTANELGLFDMSGNVWEWCQDSWGPYPCDANNPAVSDRVYRGGSWLNIAQWCRVAYRQSWQPGGRDYLLGFRLALSLK
ncbi:MAG: formylglycine-generating enzyme family protein [Saprospiraceae bacterium]